MGRFLEILKYVAGAGKAIANALEVLHNEWPTDNPFASPGEKKKGEGKVIIIEPETDKK